MARPSGARPLSPAQIKQLRKVRKETAREFARRLGVHYVTVSRWENDQATPSDENFRAMLNMIEARKYGNHKVCPIIESIMDQVITHCKDPRERGCLIYVRRKLQDL